MGKKQELMREFEEEQAEIIEEIIAEEEMLFGYESPEAKTARGR